MSGKKMKRLRYLGIALVALSVIFAGLTIGLPAGKAMSAVDYDPCQPCQSYQSAGEEPYTIMHPSPETLLRWKEEYDNSPRAPIHMQMLDTLSDRGSHSVLSHLQYTPSQRNQGSCGNCWAWAGTGVMEIALDVQNGIKDRLSIQYLNSNYNGGTGSDWACCGGSCTAVATFYTSTGQAIPWDNANAHWQDGSRTCGDEATTVDAGDITTTPNYPIKSIQQQSITTFDPDTPVDQATAIANIKNILDQDKAIYLSFLLPTSADWDNFFDFWDDEPESTIWNPNSSCGGTYGAGGGGHGVLVVGYNDDEGTDNDYWIVVNSWGTAGGGRPNGIFRLDMDMDYDCIYYLFIPPDWYYDFSFKWQTLDITYDIWESYSDLDPLTHCDDFSDYDTENTVYMYGTGFEAIHEYRVAYYDGSNNNRVTETEPSDGSGNLSSHRQFVDGTDVVGDWHVIVCETAYSPPDTYNASWEHTLASDTFAVQEEAIPEFPTVMAAILSFSLCVGVYFWMRKKATHHSGLKPTL